MKEIKLTRNKVALVDDEDFEYLSQFNWRALKDHNTWYAVRYSSDNSSIKMHRELMNVADRKILVDHKDQNGLNNTKDNLRLCTHAQNMANRKFQANNTSGYRGVAWDKKNKKWRAAIKINGKTTSLGNYDDPIEAAKVRDAAALKYYGEFARLNFS